MIVTVCSALCGSNRHDMPGSRPPAIRKAVIFRRRPDQLKRVRRFTFQVGCSFFPLLFYCSAFSQVPKEYQNVSSERYLRVANIRRRHLHCSQRLNNVQARGSDRRQKTADESHKQGKAKGCCDDRRGKSEGKGQLGERAEVQCRNRKDLEHRGER
jgi:hypothetical protein